MGQNRFENVWKNNHTNGAWPHRIFFKIYMYFDYVPYWCHIIWLINYLLWFNIVKWRIKKYLTKLEQILTVTVDFQIGQKEATCGGLDVHWRKTLFLIQIPWELISSDCFSTSELIKARMTSQMASELTIKFESSIWTWI